LEGVKLLITLLGFLNGAYMLLDGIFVLIKGNYIGSEKPEPWANVFYKLNINVYKLGPLFIPNHAIGFYNFHNS
jgi:hypothetical protein